MVVSTEDTKEEQPAADPAKAENAEPTDTTESAPSSKATDADADATLTALAERLRFFFSDANLRQDAFMRKYLMHDDHLVPVDVLLRFNTIKHHTEAVATVVQAARLVADRLVLSDDATKIGLVHPFTEAKMDENIPLSLYVSNLPLDEHGKKYEVSTDDIRNLFDNADHIVLVKLRFRHSDKADDDISDLQPSVAAASEGQESVNGKGVKKGRRMPTGAALIEFDSIEELKQAATKTVTTSHDASAEKVPDKPLTLGGSTLSVMLLRDYIDGCKSKSKKSGATKRKTETDAKGNVDTAPKKQDEDAKSRTFSVDWKPGCVIALKGITTAENCDRESILTAVAAAMDTTVQEMKVNKTVYVDFSRGQTEGALRFAEPSDAIAKLCAKLQTGDVTIGGAKVESAVVLDGDVETTYWDNFMAFKTKQMNQRHDERNSSSRQKNKRTRRN